MVSWAFLHHFVHSQCACCAYSFFKQHSSLPYPTMNAWSHSFVQPYIHYDFFLYNQPSNKVCYKLGTVGDNNTIIKKNNYNIVPYCSVIAGLLTCCFDLLVLVLVFVLGTISPCSPGWHRTSGNPPISTCPHSGIADVSHCCQPWLESYCTWPLPVMMRATQYLTAARRRVSNTGVCHRPCSASAIPTEAQEAVWVEQWGLQPPYSIPLRMRLTHTLYPVSHLAIKAIRLTTRVIGAFVFK